MEEGDWRREMVVEFQLGEKVIEGLRVVESEANYIAVCQWTQSGTGK